MRRPRAEKPFDSLHVVGPGAGRDAVAIMAWLRQSRRRHRRSTAKRMLVQAGFYCLLATTCGLLAARILYRTAVIHPDAPVTCSKLPALAVGFVALSCFIVWALAYLATRPSLLSVARRADAYLSLDDRLPTALECMSGRATLLSPLLIRDTASRIQTLEPPGMVPRRPPIEERLVPLAVVAVLMASAFDIVYPASPVRHKDPVVQQEGEILEAVARRLEDTMPPDQDVRRARSLLRKTTELAKDMKSGIAGPQDAAEGLARLLEELTLRGLDAKPQPGEGLHRANQPGLRKTPRTGGLTNVLDYGEDLESVRRDISSLRGREMSPDETAMLARKLKDLAQKIGEDSALGEASKQASEALTSDTGEERENALEEFLREAERAQSAEELSEPLDRDAMEELKEAISRAHRALEERLSRAGAGGPGSEMDSEEGEKRAGGEITRSRTRSGPPSSEEEEGRLSAPGTERGSRTPGPPAPRLESIGPVYPAEGLPGQGDVHVTTVLGPGASGGAAQAQDREAEAEVEVEESATVREEIPTEYRAIIERYFK